MRLYSKVRYSYENHRSKTYQETTCGAGIYRALRLQAVYAETKPYNNGQSRWHVLKEDSGKAVVLGTQGQPLGQTVSSFSSCLLIPLISTLPRLFGECLKDSVDTACGLCLDWQSVLRCQSRPGGAGQIPLYQLLQKKPDMFIYFSV